MDDEPLTIDLDTLIELDTTLPAIDLEPPSIDLGDADASEAV
jgi:hypothetical protein